jgi:hypothetical protein
MERVDEMEGDRVLLHRAKNQEMCVGLSFPFNSLKIL